MTSERNGFWTRRLAVCVTALVAAGLLVVPEPDLATFKAAAFVEAGSKLVPHDESAAHESAFGYSVAISANGKTALVGGYKDDNSVGAAWVFNRSGASWKQQGTKLTAKGEHGPAWFGQSVALSGDGRTALIGSPQDNVTVGSAWVFTHSGAAWTQQAKLIGSKPGPTVQDGFGISVAVSADGNTALVGGYTYNDTVGAAFAFRRTGSTWRRLGKILTGTGEIGLGQFGATVALSADGRTAMVAAPGDDEGFGAVWFYTLGASGWTPASGKIKVKRAKGHSTFGSSAALSAHGDVAVIGGSRAGANKGAAWIFTRSGSTWKQGPELIAAGAAGATTLGYSASLSSSGTTAVVGGPNDHGGHGAAWVFTRSGSRWRQSSKLTATAEQGVGSFGFGVGVSADGKTAVIGGPNDSNGAGAAWIRRNT